MKKLLLAIMLLCVSCVYAADFPHDADVVLDYLYTKLGNTVSRTSISTNGIDGKMCLLQYQACKDERSMLRLLTRHIAVADQLMDSEVNGDGQRGLLIAYASLICVNTNLKDKTLAAGIAIGMIQPNIELASDSFTDDTGKRYLANEILDASIAIDNDEAIVKAYNLVISITQKSPNIVDPYHIKYAYYLNNHGDYAGALSQLNFMTDSGMVVSTSAFKAILNAKLNKKVK